MKSLAGVFNKEKVLAWAFSGHNETFRRLVDSSTSYENSISASLVSRSLLQPGIINGPEKVVKLFYFQTQFYANICKEEQHLSIH